MVKAKNHFLRSLSLLLAILIIIPLSTITAYGLDFDPNANQGNTTGGDYVGGGGGIGWSVAKQGYRVTLLSGNQLFPSLGANAVKDIVYSQPPSGATELETNRLGQTRVGRIPDIIGSGNLASLSGMPPSLTADMAANGIAVREYLLAGTGGSGGGQGNPGGGSGGSGSGSGSGSGGGGLIIQFLL